MPVIFNPLVRQGFDDTGNDVNNDGTTAPIDQVDGYLGLAYVDAEGRIYFFINGDRYRVTGTLDNPASDNAIWEDGDNMIWEDGDNVVW
jgi:hypothetical protein